jgi:hypothetical protein
MKHFGKKKSTSCIILHHLASSCQLLYGLNHVKSPLSLVKSQFFALFVAPGAWRRRGRPPHGMVWHCLRCMVELQGAENHGKIHGKATFFGETLGNPVFDDLITK